jgi:hypothetical protein
MFRNLLTAIAVLSLGACTTAKVVQLDPATGYFPSMTKANLIVNKPVNLDAQKALVLVPNGEFSKGQMQNIGYFTEVMNFDDLEKAIIQNKLTDKVPTVKERIGINNAARNYRPFLWFHLNIKTDNGNRLAQYILTDALTMEDYMVAETKLDFVWTGVNDQNNWYPMYNSLIDYIKANSKTYRK